MDKRQKEARHIRRASHFEILRQAFKRLLHSL